MPRKRIIFSLLYESGHFVLSRNFRLQRIGDLEWLNKNYNFRTVSRHIDELVILNVSRGNNYDSSAFIRTVQDLAFSNFVPISVGGFGTDMDVARELFRSGADKLVINTALFRNHIFVERVVETFGRQSVIGSVDVIFGEENDGLVVVNKGQETLSGDLGQIFHSIPENLIGELLLRSVRRDGTGQGLDVGLARLVGEKFRGIPLLIAGGVGKPEHIRDGLNHPDVDGVVTANLLNFIGTGLEEARKICLTHGVDLAHFAEPNSAGW